MRKMDPDILACNYVRIYLHASLTYLSNNFQTKKTAKIQPKYTPWVTVTVIFGVV